jgi:hypothetical protein
MAERQPQTKPRKKRRVFLWTFLAIQAIFLAWIIGGSVGAASEPCPPTLSAEACQAAAGIGTAIGVGLIIALWVAVDVILGIGYLIYRVSTRR